MAKIAEIAQGEKPEHPGVSRRFMPFCFSVLGTTKNSLFTRTPYENHAHSTSGYPPPFLFNEPLESD